MAILVDRIASRIPKVRLRKVLDLNTAPDRETAGSDCTAASTGTTWGICTRRADKLERARSRLYRSEILQENMRWKALAEIYKMLSFAQLDENPV